MRKSTIIRIALIVLSAAFFVWALLDSGKQAPPAAQNTAGENLPAAVPSFEGKINDEGGVEILVQPLDVRSSEWTFGITLNTHTGNLDADLAGSATLTDDRGNIFTPIRWDGAPPGGHHRQGTLIFQAITPRPDSITLTVKNIGDVAEREFTWQLKGR